MAAEKGKTKGSVTKRRTGTGPTARKGAEKAKAVTTLQKGGVDVSRRSRSRSEAREAVEEAVALEQDRIVDAAEKRVTHIACDSSWFQLKVDKKLVIDGQVLTEPGWDLDFGSRGFIIADEKMEAAVWKILAGEWSDGRVDGETFRKNAERAGLRIVKYGLAQCPMPTWDVLEAEKVVAAAWTAGLLTTEAQVKDALRYEREAGEHEPAREPRERVIADLESVLETLREKAGEPVYSGNRARSAAEASVITPPVAAL